MAQRFYLIFWCLALGLASYVALDYWSTKATRGPKKFERLWAEDVDLLEKSGKLPAAWFKVKDVKLIGGTPETKDWLKRIQIPVHPAKEGTHNLEVLVVVWDEGGKKGVMVQYDLVEIATKNNVWELGRTLIVKGQVEKKGFEAFLDELRPPGMDKPEPAKAAPAAPASSAAPSSPEAPASPIPTAPPATN